MLRRRARRRSSASSIRGSITSASSATTTMTTVAKASSTAGFGLPAARGAREEDHAVGVRRDVAERPDHLGLAPAGLPGDGDGGPHAGVELATELLDEFLLLARDLDVTLRDQHLAVPWSHAEELHEAADYAKRPPASEGAGARFAGVVARVPRTSTGPGPAPISRSPCSTARAAVRRASSAASRGVAPWARKAASADACVQPEPWAAPSGCLGPGISVIVAPSSKRPVAMSRWPPVRTTWAGPRSWTARTRSCGSRIARPSRARTRASGTFGVATAARGRMSSTSASRASGARRTAPDSATITGSTTSGVSGSASSRARATASTVGASLSMPSLIARGGRSSRIARTCASMISGGTGWTAVTPTVFCAVIAVMALVPWTPQAAKALRSAWMPAPPPESEPAMVRQTGTRVMALPRLGAPSSLPLLGGPLGATDASHGQRPSPRRDDPAAGGAADVAGELELGERRERLGTVDAGGGQRAEGVAAVAHVVEHPLQSGLEDGRRVARVGPGTEDEIQHV